MLAIGRSGLRRFTPQRRFFAVAASSKDSATVTSRTGRRVNTQFKNLSEEHINLQNKYKNSLSLTNLKSIHDLIDVVEWKDSAILGTTLHYAISLLSDPKQKVSALTDRETSVILSIFGEKAMSTVVSKRKELLDNAMKLLEERGATIGPLSRNTLLTVRLDNGETVNVVETLQEWEKLGFVPTTETYEVLSRSYALQGNVQGVINIINHVKSSGTTITDNLMQNMLYAVAATGSYDQANKLLEKFSSPTNDVKLRFSIASAALNREDYAEVVRAVKIIPSSSKSNTVENNKYILDLYLDLVERHKLDVAEEIKSALSTTPDGSSLTEYHHNPRVVARIRKNRRSGNIQAALAMYSILHPVFRSPRIEDLLRESAISYFHSPGVTMEQARQAAIKLHEQELIGDVDEFLLQSSLPTSLFVQLFNANRSNDDVISKLVSQANQRYKLAKKLYQPLVDSSASFNEKALSLANIGIVCLFPSKEVSSIEFYGLLFKLGGHDMNLVTKALSQIPQSNIRREFGTVFVQKLLMSHTDPLAGEKLKKLIESEELRSLNISRFSKQFEKLIQNKNRSREDDESNLKLIAKLLALNFPGHSKVKELFVVNHLVNILKNDAMDDDRARILVGYLEKEENVAIPSAELIEAQKTLRDSKMNEKASLLYKLKKKNTTYARWQESGLEKLEKEWHTLRSDPKFSKDVVGALQDVLFKKLQTEPIQYKIILKCLNTLKAENIPLPASCSKVCQLALDAALDNRDIEATSSLWEIRPSNSMSSSTALRYISALFISGDIEKADRVCEDLRTSAAPINGRSLEAVGNLLDGVDQNKLNSLTDYLSNKFGLKPAAARYIVHRVKLDEIKKLIAENKLTEAFNVACEESQAIGVPFAHFVLFEAAFKTNDGAMATNIHNLVRSYVGQNNAILDTAYAFLRAGLTQEASKLLASKGLTITSRKMKKFITESVRNNRADVLHGLFLGLSEDEKASTLDLNDLLLDLCKIYYKRNELESISKLEQEVRKRSFPMDEKIRNVFQSVEKQIRSSTNQK